MNETRAVQHPQASLEIFRAVHCKRCQKQETCHDDRDLERNCIQAALLDETIFARRQHTERGY